MSEKEIRKANRRALPGFLLMLVVCVAVGGGIGYLFGKYRLDTLAGGLKRACAFFGGQIAPWLLLALAVSLRRSAALAPGKPAREMLFCVALGVALLLPHLWDEQRLRGVLKLVQPYLLLPGAVLILCLLPGAVLCKRRRKP